MRGAGRALVEHHHVGVLAAAAGLVGDDAGVADGGVLRDLDQVDLVDADQRAGGGQEGVDDVLDGVRGEHGR